MIPRRMMALPYRARVLNVRTRMRDGRACEGVSSEAEANPPARWSLLEGAVNPQARQNPLEGGVNPRARRNLLEGAFEWATPVGRGDHSSVGRAPCVRLSEMCLVSVLCRL
jgi:hypothetical protein